MKQDYNIDQFIGRFDGFMDHKDCDKVIEFFEAREKSHEIFDRSKSEGTSKTSRMDRNTFINYNDMSLNQFTVNGDNFVELTPFRIAVNSALTIYCKETGILDYTGVGEIHWTPFKLQKTAPGQGFHEWHVEHTSTLDYFDRVVVFTVYLNDIEEGGETEFLFYNKRVPAKKGRICLFPAYFPYVHRGNPPINQTKYIVTGWFNCDPYMLKLKK